MLEISNEANQLLADWIKWSDEHLGYGDQMFKNHIKKELLDNGLMRLYRSTPLYDVFRLTQKGIFYGRKIC